MCVVSLVQVGSSPILTVISAYPVILTVEAVAKVQHLLTVISVKMFLSPIKMGRNFVCRLVVQITTKMELSADHAVASAYLEEDVLDLQVESAILALFLLTSTHKIAVWQIVQTPPTLSVT